VQYGSFPLSFGEQLRFTVLEPIEPNGDGVEEIIGKAEQRIRKALNSDR